jgi:hypothetical protein
MADNERKTERIQVLMTPSELEALDDWAFANRIRSRGEAVRRLVEAGLSGQGAPKSPDAGGPASASSSRPIGKSAQRARKSPGPIRRQG